jgi:hypothetical protein
MAYMRICAQCSAYYEAPPAAYNNPRIAPYCPRCLAREAQRTSAAADRDGPGRATMKVSDRCAECGAVHPDGADPHRGAGRIGASARYRYVNTRANTYTANVAARPVGKPRWEYSNRDDGIEVGQLYIGDRLIGTLELVAESLPRYATKYDLYRLTLPGEAPEVGPHDPLNQKLYARTGWPGGTTGDDE